jgi:5-formyltetrahydrofolate cyclo-ligase
VTAGADAFLLRAKQLMRRRFRGHRQSLPVAAVAERSAAICQRFLAHERVKAAGAVALFWPIERFKEVDLRAADQALRARGVAVAYPAIDPDTQSMSFHLATPEEMSASGTLAFMAPSLDAPRPTRLDVIAVPGVAFDADGYRIGYGAGFYDRALPAWSPPALAIGVAFDMQLAVDLPHTSSDVPVDVVLTETRLLVASR